MLTPVRTTATPVRKPKKLPEIKSVYTGGRQPSIGQKNTSLERLDKPSYFQRKNINIVRKSQDPKLRKTVSNGNYQEEARVMQAEQAHMASNKELTQEDLYGMKTPNAEYQQRFSVVAVQLPMSHALGSELEISDRDSLKEIEASAFYPPLSDIQISASKPLQSIETDDPPKLPSSRSIVKMQDASRQVERDIFHSDERAI
jgi:hypothetical protein